MCRFWPIVSDEIRWCELFNLWLEHVSQNDVGGCWQHSVTIKEKNRPLSTNTFVSGGAIIASEGFITLMVGLHRTSKVYSGNKSVLIFLHIVIVVANNEYFWISNRKRRFWHVEVWGVWGSMMFDLYAERYFCDIYFCKRLIKYFKWIWTFIYLLWISYIYSTYIRTYI